MIVELPLYIELGKKKYRINLNQYRNWHYHVSNKIKQEYKRIVLARMTYKKFDRVKLIFTLYKGSKRKIDRANVLCITEKFFCDTLVAGRFIDDDDDSIIVETVYRSGGVCRENPRVEVEIIECGAN